MKNDFFIHKRPILIYFFYPATGKHVFIYIFNLFSVWFMKNIPYFISGNRILPYLRKFIILFTDYIPISFSNRILAQHFPPGFNFEIITLVLNHLVGYYLNVLNSVCQIACQLQYRIYNWKMKHCWKLLTNFGRGIFVLDK